MGDARLNNSDVIDAVAKAIELVSEALARLDEVNAPADIGAHLDLAIHRMKGVESL